MLSENYGIESNNYGATETVQWDEGGKYPYSAVSVIRDPLNLKYFHRWCFSQSLTIIIFDVY